MTLLICPVRPGDNNPELRYALRSWEANLHLGSLQLMVVGSCPTWLQPDHFVAGNNYASVPLAVWDNIMIGSREAGNTCAIYMNDDFFAMKPIEEIVPERRDITLAQHINIFPENASLWWPKSLRTTKTFLAYHGHLDPWSYELHRPMPAYTGDMLNAMGKWIGGRGSNDSLPQWRTVYGALCGISAKPVEDVKLGIIRAMEDTDWVSTSDASWRTYGRHIAPCFQKRSRWEID